MTLPFTLIFMFLVFWRPQEWLVPAMYGWPVLDFIVYAALLGLLVELDSGRAKMPKTPAVALAGGLWVAAVFSHVVQGYFQGMLNTIPDAFKLCFFLVLLVVVVDRVGNARAVVMVFVLGACLMSVHALMQQQLGHGFAGQPPMYVFKEATGEYQKRSQFFGIFGDPNDLAQFLAASLPLVFAIPHRLSFERLALSTGVAVLLFVALLTTHSRGGVVALLAACVAMLFMVLPSRWLPYAGALALAGGLLLCGLKGGLMMDASASERVVYWGLANRAFKAHPLFGIGYGMFWQITGSSRAAHNAFVSCYTEVGLVGYWFWFSLLQLGVIGCWRTRLALRKPVTASQIYLRRLAGLTIASIIGFAAGGYFLSRSFIFPFFFLFGLSNAIPLIAQRLLPAGHPPLLQVRRDVFGWGTVTTLFSVIYIYISILILNRVMYGG